MIDNSLNIFEILAIADKLFEQEQYSEAIDLYTTCIEGNEQVLRAYIGRGRAYENLGKYHNAIADYSKFLELEPTDTDVYLLRAEMYEVCRAYDEAIADFTTLLTLEPARVHNYYRRSWVFLNAGRYAEALADIDRLIAVTPENDITLKHNYAHRSTINKLAGNSADALHDLATGITLPIHPDYSLMQSTLYRDRAQIFFDIDKIDEAISDFETAIELGFIYRGAWRPLGLCFLKKHEYHKAIEQFSISIADYLEYINPEPTTFSDDYYMRGHTYQLIGELDKTYQDYTEALRIDPDSPHKDEMTQFIQDYIPA